MLSAGRITGLNPITWRHDSNGSADGVEQHDVHAPPICNAGLMSSSNPTSPTQQAEYQIITEQSEVCVIVW